MEIYNTKYETPCFHVPIIIDLNYPEYHNRKYLAYRLRSGGGYKIFYTDLGYKDILRSEVIDIHRDFDWFYI